MTYRDQRTAHAQRNRSTWAVNGRPPVELLPQRVAELLAEHERHTNAAEALGLQLRDLMEPTRDVDAAKSDMAAGGAAVRAGDSPSETPAADDLAKSRRDTEARMHAARAAAADALAEATHVRDTMGRDPAVFAALRKAQSVLRRKLADAERAHADAARESALAAWMTGHVYTDHSTVEFHDITRNGLENVHLSFAEVQPMRAADVFAALALVADDHAETSDGADTAA